MSCHILVIGHGTLPRDLIKAAEMICGATEEVEAICLPADQDMEAYRQAIARRMEDHGGEGLLVLADLKGGTPFLTASRMMRDHWGEKIELITGVNLPMLTEVLSSLDVGVTVQELAACAAQAGIEGVTDFRQALAGRRQEEGK